MTTEVNVVKNGNDYALQITKDSQTAQVQLKGCKSEQEAEMIKQALLTEINKAEVQHGTKGPGVGEKLDKAA